MKKTISILLASLLLAAACLVPASALAPAPQSVIPKFDPASTAAVHAVCEAASFVNYYNNFGELGGWLNDAVSYIEETYPLCVAYKISGNLDPVVTVSFEQLKDTFYSVCPTAPVNFFENGVLMNLSTYYDSVSETFSFGFMGGVGGFEIPECVGYTSEGNKFNVYFSMREREYLAPEFVTEPGVPEIEHDGKTYIYDAEEDKYFCRGEINPVGSVMELLILESGVVINSQSIGETLPPEMKMLPPPDGDANGDCKVNAKDVTAIMRHLVGWTPAVFSEYASDYHRNDALNARDVITLMKYLVSVG